MAKHTNDWKTISSLLRDWYGNKRATLEMLEYLPKESKVGDVIQNVMNKYVDAKLGDMMTIKNAWTEIAGPQIAAVCKPYKLDNKTLIVEIRHPVWMQEFKRNNMDKILLDKINSLFKKEMCTKIALVPFGRQ